MFIHIEDKHNKVTINATKIAAIWELRLAKVPANALDSWNNIEKPPYNDFDDPKWKKDNFSRSVLQFDMDNGNHIYLLDFDYKKWNDVLEQISKRMQLTAPMFGKGGIA